MSPEQLAYRAAHYTPWYERIGDGGPVAWVITAAYFLAALMCLRAMLRSPESERRGLWLLAGAALFLLGVNKQLDLQVVVLEVAREMSLRQGWHGVRRTVQLASYGLALALAMGAGWWLLPRLRRQGRELRAAFAGLAVVGLYVFLRMAKFQHVVFPDTQKPEGPGWLAAIELAGITIAGGAAWWSARRSPRT
jgi:hypothetical protein